MRSYREKRLLDKTYKSCLKPKGLKAFQNTLPEMRWFVFLLASFLASSVHAAELLLVMEVYARVVPAGQAEPIPDPFIEAIVRGETAAITGGIQELQGKSFQISSKVQDFAPVIAGLEGQRVSVRLTAIALPNGACAVTQFQAFGLAKTSRSQVGPVGSSVVVSRSGFTVAPGQRLPQSVSAQFEGGRVIYYLIFSAAKGVAG
jgi:hypothetical protein